MVFVLIGLVVLALSLSQLLIGGARHLYVIPSVLLLATAAVVSLWPRLKGSHAFRGSCIVTTLLLCAYLFARNRLSPVDYLARTDFFIISGSLLVYLIFALFLDRSKPRLRVFLVLLVVAVAQVIVGAIQFRGGEQFMALPWIARLDDSWRASGFYISPNHFAGLVEVVALVAISLVCWGDLKLSHKIAIGYGALCCIAGLVLSGSRGGYLSFSFGLLVFVILSLIVQRMVRPGRVLLLVVSAVGVLLLVVAASLVLIQQSSVIRARVAAINDPENMRWLLWHAALDQYELNPRWGTGSGTYLYYGRMFRDVRVQHDPIHVHNDYLHLLAEYGDVGAALFAIFVAAHLIAGLRNLRLLAKDEASPWGARANQLACQLGALSAIAAYMAHSVVDFNLHIPANAFVMAIMFGIVANPALRRRETSLVQKGIGIFARVGLVATGTWAAIFAVPKLPGEWYAEKARVALRDYQLADARAHAAKALQYEKKNPDIYYYAGEAAREMFAKKMGPAETLGAEAVTMFQAAIRLFPEDFRSVVKLAHAYDNLRLFDLAEEQLRRASELDPNVGSLYSYYGLHYHLQGMFEDALEHYEYAQQLHWDDKLAQAGIKHLRKVLEQDTIVFPELKEIDFDEATTPETFDVSVAPPSPTPAATPAPTSKSVAPKARSSTLKFRESLPREPLPSSRPAR